MLQSYTINTESGIEIVVTYSEQMGCTISISKDKLSKGYRDELAVINLTLKDVFSLQKVINSITVNEKL